MNMYVCVCMCVCLCLCLSTQHLCLATVRAQHKLWVCSDHQVGMCVTKLLSPHISRGSWTETRECLHPLVRLMLSAGLMCEYVCVFPWASGHNEKRIVEVCMHAHLCMSRYQDTPRSGASQRPPPSSGPCPAPVT